MCQNVLLLMVPSNCVQLEFGSHERDAESYCQESSELDTERQSFLSRPFEWQVLRGK